MAKLETTSTFRTSDQIKQDLSELHGSVSSGAGRAVEIYLALRSRSLHNIKGRFDRKELSYLVDMLNGTMFDPKLAVIPDVLIAGIEDADEYEQLGAKWDVDIEVLSAKVRDLTSAESCFLIEEINRFWYGQGYGAPTPELEAFLDEYARNDT